MTENQNLGSANGGTIGQLPHAPPHIREDFQLFEMVRRSDDIFSVIVNPNVFRTAHYEFLSQIRLTDY